MSRFQLSGHLVKRLAADATLSAAGTNTAGPLLPGPGDVTGLGIRDDWRYGQHRHMSRSKRRLIVPAVDVTAPQGPDIMGTAGPGHAM